MILSILASIGVLLIPVILMLMWNNETPHKGNKQ